MRRRIFVSGLGALALTALAGCGSNEPTRATSSNSVTATSGPNVPATQTRGAEANQVASLQTQVATLSAPTAAIAIPSATIAPSPIPTRVPATATLGRTATPVPAKVELVASNISGVKSSSDSGYVFGEVKNVGQGEADRIQIAASLLSDTGQTVGAGSVSDIFAPVHVLKPGEKMAFSAYVDKMPATWKEIRVQVQASAATASSKARYYLDLKAEGGAMSQPTRSTGSTSVTGQVVNTGSGTAKLVGVTVGFYAADGRLLAVDDSYAKLEQIGPGISAPFSVETYNLKEPATGFEVFIRASRVD